MEAKHFIGARTFINGMRDTVTEDTSEALFKDFKTSGRLRFTPKSATPEAWTDMCGRLDIDERSVGSIYSLSHADGSVMLVALDEKSFTHPSLT